MTVARVARRCAVRRFHRGRAGTVALLTLLWLVQLAAPVLGVAQAGDDGAPCCRGRCCCSGATPSDTDCLRAACPCGSETHTPALPDPEGGLALLPAAPRTPRLRCFGASWRDAALAPRFGAPRAPDPPPWPPLASPAFA